jgi:hypothetical protein
MSGVVPPEQALVLQRAVHLAHEEGFGEVIFASDCLSLVARIQSTAPNRSLVGMLVDDIKDRARSFTSASFIHVKRGLNEATHVLAKSYISFTSSEIFHTVPDYIRGNLCIMYNVI